MGALSRSKGARGERELRRLLEAELGGAIVRNLEQTRSGGHDLLGVDGWAVEVKRYRRVTRALVATWWAQACEQAERAGLRPVVLYREDRGEWLAVVHLADLHPGMERWPGFEWCAVLTLPAWCAVVRDLGSSGAICTARSCRRVVPVENRFRCIGNGDVDKVTADT